MLYCNVIYILQFCPPSEVLSKLTQINFNGTHFINARLTQTRIFCLTRGLACRWRNGDPLCCHHSNIADPFSDFFPFKKTPKPYLVSENCRYCHTSVRSCFPSTRPPPRAPPCWFSNFTCKYITIVFILCVFDFLR